MQLRLHIVQSEEEAPQLVMTEYWSQTSDSIPDYLNVTPYFAWRVASKTPDKCSAELRKRLKPETVGPVVEEIKKLGCLPEEEGYLPGFPRKLLDTLQAELRELVNGSALQMDPQAPTAKRKVTSKKAFSGSEENIALLEREYPLELGPRASRVLLGLELEDAPSAKYCKAFPRVKPSQHNVLGFLWIVLKRCVLGESADLTGKPADYLYDAVGRGSRDMIQWMTAVFRPDTIGRDKKGNEVLLSAVAARFFKSYGSKGKITVVAGKSLINCKIDVFVYDSADKVSSTALRDQPHPPTREEIQKLVKLIEKELPDPLPMLDEVKLQVSRFGLPWEEVGLWKSSPLLPLGTEDSFRLELKSNQNGYFYVGCLDKSGKGSSGVFPWCFIYGWNDPSAAFRNKPRKTLSLSEIYHDEIKKQGEEHVEIRSDTGIGSEVFVVALSVKPLDLEKFQRSIEEATSQLRRDLGERPIPLFTRDTMEMFELQLGKPDKETRSAESSETEIEYVVGTRMKLGPGPKSDQGNLKTLLKDPIQAVFRRENVHPDKAWLVVVPTDCK